MNHNARILPAYPIFLKDPNFSLWSYNEVLNSGNLHTWWGEEKNLFGFIHTGRQTYCFMGDAAKWYGGIKNAEQTYIGVTAFSTDYEFKAGDAVLKVRFVSPLPPDDVKLLSMPVCYMEYEIIGGEDAEISLFVNRNVAYNKINPDKRVSGGKMMLNGFESAFFGLKRQLPLSNSDDAIGADWGYYYLAGESAYILDESDLRNYLAGGGTRFKNAGENRYLGAVNKSAKGAILLGYDDVVSIDYFGEFLKGYYLKYNSIKNALDYVWRERDKINAQLSVFENKLKAKSENFGKEYLNILNASLRQSVAGHKLVEDGEGNLLFLSKECYSNGCIATVDISYPSMPLYLYSNVKLLKGMLLPIFKFAKTEVWKYDFAPHDAGTYPACCGQVYGLLRDKEIIGGNFCEHDFGDTRFPYYALPQSSEIYDYEFQMPVEESANMIIMLYAAYRTDADLSLYEQNRELVDKWVEYLVKYGLKPDNQLCTDDFAGHLKNNINLAIKATVGIAAYAELCAAAGNEEKRIKYRNTAEKFAAEIIGFGNKFTHLPLAWDLGEQTFSLKYNFAFDKVLSLGLFPQQLLEREVDYYIKNADRFGVRLDTREDYSKSDWLTWVAYLTDDNGKRKKLIKLLDDYLKYSPSRIPFGDWYDVRNGEFYQFRARTVQGGCFILLLNSELKK